MIKIIFFDIDGTLLPLGEKTLSKKTFYALKQLQRKGILICLSSGRGNLSLPNFEGFNADVFATFNGAYCYNNKEDIYKEPIIKEDIITVINNCKKLNRFLSINTKEKIFANGLDKDLLTYFSFGHEVADVVKDFDAILKEDIYKIMLSCSIKEREEVMKGTKYCKIAAWWDRAIDIVNINSGKGNAVKRILNYYGFKKEESICFGDGENDTEMFPEVGISVAMGNSIDSVKRKARFVCDDVKNDGVYKFLIENKIID